MDENTGWIKLYRKLLENALIKEPRLLQVMVYCLLKANHKETKMLWNGQEIILKPGQFITGRTQANNDLGLKSIMFDRKLKILQNRGFLNRETNNRFSIITVNNWEKYQNRQEEVNSQMNNKRITDEQQMNTNKNDKNEEETTQHVDDVVSKIFQIFKGSMKQSKIQNLIKGKDPDEMLRLAHYCSEEGENPPGLFTTMVKENAEVPKRKVGKPKIPPPPGGYQSGKGPLLIGDDAQAERVEPEEKEIDESDREEEEPEEEFQERMRRDVERFKKLCKSNSLGDPIHKQLGRLRIKR